MGSSSSTHVYEHVKGTCLMRQDAEHFMGHKTITLLSMAYYIGYINEMTNNNRNQHISVKCVCVVYIL